MSRQSSKSCSKRETIEEKKRFLEACEVVSCHRTKYLRPRMNAYLIPEELHVSWLIFCLIIHILNENDWYIINVCFKTTKLATCYGVVMHKFAVVDKDDRSNRIRNLHIKTISNQKYGCTLPTVLKNICRLRSQAVFTLWHFARPVACVTLFRVWTRCIQKLAEPIQWKGGDKVYLYWDITSAIAMICGKIIHHIILDIQHQPSLWTNKPVVWKRKVWNEVDMLFKLLAVILFFSRI